MSGNHFTVENTDVQIQIQNMILEVQNLDNSIDSLIEIRNRLKRSIESLEAKVAPSKVETEVTRTVKTITEVEKDDWEAKADAEAEAEAEAEAKAKAEAEAKAKADAEAEVEAAPLIAETEVKETKVKETKVKETKVKETKVYNDWGDEMEADVEAKAKAKAEAKARPWSQVTQQFGTQEGMYLPIYSRDSLAPPVLRTPPASPAKSNNSCQQSGLFTVPGLNGGKNIAGFLHALTDGFKAKGNKSKDVKQHLDDDVLFPTSVSNIYVVRKANGSLDVKSGWTTNVNPTIKDSVRDAVDSLRDQNKHELLLVHVNKDNASRPYSVFTYKREFTTPDRHSNSSLSDYVRYR